MSRRSGLLPDLTSDELRRYARHVLLPELGLDGQRRLKAARVLLVGAGGLGSPLALYLAAAGVGTLGVVDFDAVDVSNLQRQIAHGTSAVGVPKLASLEARVADLNPNVRVVRHDVRLARGNAMDIVGAYDVVADGADNFATRYLVNDACVLAGKPNAHGSILRFEGQATVFDAARGPCYRCLFPEPPPAGLVPSCAEAGVLGVLPGVIGSIQATEVIKLLTGLGEPLVGRLLLYDALAMRFRELQVRKDPQCPVCGESPSIRELQDYDEICGTPAAGGEGVFGGGQDDLTVQQLDERRRRGDDFVLMDVRQPEEWRIAHVEGAVLVPLATLPARAHEFDRDREIVLMCHHGGRSQQALQFLRRQGFTRLKNLSGGIDAWSLKVDPSVPRY